MILKRKIFALFRDMDDDGDYDYEDAKLQYKDWKKSRKGYPMVASIIGSLGTAGAAYGGAKLAESRATKKSAKEVEKAAKKVAIEKAKSQIGKTNSKGKKITAEDVKKLFKDPKRADKFIRKHGEIDKLSKAASEN